MRHRANRPAPILARSPASLRKSLTALGNIEDYTFLDIGCGKSRAMITASEFCLRAVAGAEISPQPARVTNRNAAITKKRFPERPPLSVTAYGAVGHTLLAGKLVILLYNRFGELPLSKLISNMEAHLAKAETPHLFVVCYNPIHAKLLDNSAT